MRQAVMWTGFLFLACQGDGSETPDMGDCGEDATCDAGTFDIEECNGLDDDGDGEIDEGFGLGEPCEGDDSDLCEDDEVTCEGCSSGDDTLEECNDVDDDCDGEIDEALGVGMECDGDDADDCLDDVVTCDGCSLGEDNLEECNGLDDDCDTLIDETFGIGDACDGDDSDPCEDDWMTCDGCTSGFDNIEICNGMDDLCDDNVDVSCEPYGWEIEWATFATGTGSDIAYAVASGPDGSVAVAGQFVDDLTFGLGEPNETPMDALSSLSDAFVAKYDADGQLLWARQIGGESIDRAQEVAVASDGSVLVFGDFTMEVTFEPDSGGGEIVLTEIMDGQDLYFAKYASDGTLLWAKAFSGAGTEETSGLELLSDDSAVVMGTFPSSISFGAGDSGEVVATSGELFLARVEPDGTPVWAAQGFGSFAPWALDARSDDGVVVGGAFSGIVMLGVGESEMTALSPASGVGMFVARYASDGTLAWARRADTVDGSSLEARAVAASDDHVFVAGGFGSTLTFAPGEESEAVLSSELGTSIYVASYDADGNFEWALKTEGGWGLANAAAVTTAGDVLVTGQASGWMTFDVTDPGPTTVPSLGSDVFLALYNADGTVAWAKRAGGGDATDRAWGLATTSDGGVVLTGAIEGDAVFGPGDAGAVSLGPTLSGDPFVAKFAPP